jgi:23S rRNA (adenine2503-C2)-methyltransferase
MGCDFCASTRNGLERNLSAGEIVEQFLHLRRLGSSQGRRLRTIVFMGMGEPLHNLDAVIGAIHRIAAPGLGNLGPRNITVSTVGIVPGIRRLARADLGVHLAVSLHASDDATRAQIIPAARRYAVQEILSAARDFQDATGRPVNIEYCLLAGVNDSDAHARGLAARLEGFRAHVNLIPYNSTGAPGLSGRDYQPPADSVVARFVAILREEHVVCHLRDPRGRDIMAACGQLRASTGRGDPEVDRSAPAEVARVSVSFPGARRRAEERIAR